MDFEKKYPITQRPGEFIIAQWTRGFQEIELYFHDKLIGSASGGGKLKKGVSVLSEIGPILLKLSEKPITLDVIIDGYHSPVNVSHPVKELKRTNTYFWIISVFAFIAGAIEVGIFSGWPEVMAVILGINLVIFILYILSAVFVGQGKPWAFYLGFSVFSFCTLITILALAGGMMWGILLYIFLVIRIGGEVILIMNLKTANSAVRHLKYKDHIMKDDLLDSKI